jgi:hypothetical protein
MEETNSVERGKIGSELKIGVSEIGVRIEFRVRVYPQLNAI